MKLLITTRRKGVSLYEFLIVFFIIGLIAAIALPSIRSLSPTWQINNSSRVVMSKLRQAQEDAVSTQVRHAIRFHASTNPATFDLIELGASETVLKTTTLDKDIVLILDSTITDNQIIFSSDGGPSGQGNIVISFNSRSKTINISPSGVIKVE